MGKKLPPFGPLKWKIPSNICGDGKSYRDLMFVRCYDKDFPCNSGECVLLSQRCDGRGDCSDDSDELNCKTLYWKNKLTYSKEIPPPKSKAKDATNKTVVAISITMVNILDVKELNGIWRPKFILQMEWFDSRIKMQNLNDDMQLNVLVSEERNDPWLPIVIFNNHNK